MNVAREESPTSDLRVRQAVALAIDPEVVNERQYGSSGDPTTSLLFEGSKFETDVQGVEADPEAAKALVAEAKADLGWDGTIHFLLSGAPTELALAIKAQLDAVGFNTVLDQSGTVGDYISKIVVNHDFELAIWGYNLWDAGPYSGLAEQLLSTSATNFRGYAEPEMDAALGRLRLAADDEEATEVLGEIQTIFNETAPGRVISATELGAVWDDEELAGFEFGQFGMTYFDEVHRLG
jgi:peptide/nickel transport system substrate-binding protein